MLSTAQMEHYQSQGYVVVDDTPPHFDELAAAGRRVKAQVRAGAVDVFTHWANPGEPWCIRGLLAPQFGEPVFAEHMVSDWALGYSRAFVDEPLRLGWIDLRTNPHDEDMPGGWHRDLGTRSYESSPEELLALLQKPKRHTRWYVPLIDDACLQIVPGSHLRPNTPEEQRVLAGDVHDDLSTQKTIALRRGQSLFWDGNTVHRGVMRKDVERLTLAASWAQHSDDDPPATAVDARFAWRLAESVRANLPAAMLPYYDRWRALQPADADEPA